MFRKWFKKNENKEQECSFYGEQAEDEMEESLWEIKEEYDLPTEEILNVVQSKRDNLTHMHKMISRKQKYE
tara:strand:- start:323 stop:535 length:213 start_codon:yes stop_codon:yes gene_type:complete